MLQTYKFSQWMEGMFVYEERSILPTQPSKKMITLYHVKPDALPTWLIPLVAKILHKKQINNVKRYIGTNIIEGLTINKMRNGDIFIDNAYLVSFTNGMGRIETSLTVAQRKYTEKGELKEDILFINLEPLRKVYKKSKPAYRLVDNLTTPLKGSGMYQEKTMNLVKELFKTTWSIDVATNIIHFNEGGFKVIISDSFGRVYHTVLRDMNWNSKEVIKKLVDEFMKANNNILYID